MVLIYMKYPDLLDEAPGLGDLKTPAPRPQGYVSQAWKKLLLLSSCHHSYTVRDEASAQS